MATTQIQQRQLANGIIADAQVASGANIASSKLADGSNFIKKDGSVAMTGALNMGSQLISSLQTPSSSSDAATKGYVDGLYNSFPNLFKYKDEAKAMATGNVTVSNPGTASFDGVTLSTNDRLLLTSQTAPAENGVYVFNGSGVALTRAADMDAWAEIGGALIGVAAGGTANGSKLVLFTNTATGTLGTTAVTSTVINAAAGLSSTNFVDAEIPSGSINGSNTTFTLANTPTSGTEKVYLNGIRLYPGAGNDYTISTNTITMATAPLTGERIVVDYRK